MQILVLQHATEEHPGILREFLAQDGHSYHAIELDVGEEIPPIDGYDALWVMGGPMDVWEEDQYPWLVEEKRFIRDCVQVRGVPFLGFCLGHQLLAEALGGSVGPSKQPEVGIMEVQMTEDGAQSVILDGLDSIFKVMQWHSAEVTKLPVGAQWLATSAACPVQAMSWASNAFSAQFHVEGEADTVRSWQSIEVYHNALIKALGPEGPAELEADYDANFARMQTVAERLYINWHQMVARA